MGCQNCCCNDDVNLDINTDIMPINGHEESKYNHEREEILNLTETDNLNTKLSEGSANSKKIQEKRNKKKKIDYPTKILQIINTIRKDPVAYANVIEDSIKNIIIQKKDNEVNPEILYKNKIKVVLKRGEIAFKEVAEKLRNMSPLPPLTFKKEICIPLPENEEEIRTPVYLENQFKILKRKVKVDKYFKDLIEIPEVSALLMIVNDNGEKYMGKREAILNKNYKYIGISCQYYWKTFIACFTFSSG